MRQYCHTKVIILHYNKTMGIHDIGYLSFTNERVDPADGLDHSFTWIVLKTTCLWVIVFDLPDLIMGAIVWRPERRNNSITCLYCKESSCNTKPFHRSGGRVRARGSAASDTLAGGFECPWFHS